VPADDDVRAGLRAAKESLEARFLHDPEVSLIDIGLASPAQEDAGADANEEYVLRIHVRAELDDPERFPTSVGGFRVVLLRGDYRPEAG
jgi:hypothetical protein